MPEPTSADLAREAEAEAAVFAQAANIDKLLTMLRNFDINKDNLADNEEIQVCVSSLMLARILTSRIGTASIQPRSAA
jgi:signal transducing adaptor molecule